MHSVMHPANVHVVLGLHDQCQRNAQAGEGWEKLGLQWGRQRGQVLGAFVRGRGRLQQERTLVVLHRVLFRTHPPWGTSIGRVYTRRRTRAWEEPRARDAEQETSKSSANQSRMRLRSTPPHFGTQHRAVNLAQPSRGVSRTNNRPSLDDDNHFT